MTDGRPPEPEPLATTADGTVRGRATGAAHVFRGIPYAAPPTGAARFAAPAPHTPWRGVRDARQPGPTAPQPRRDGFGAVDMTPYFGPGWVRGDDHLTVDVWAPARARRAPVLVFVHGGGFLTGSARAPLHDGTSFARDGVVLVAVNYRLGIPGFLDLPGAPPNRGLLDVVAALRWVRRDIEAFGGDPGNVTLCGQSAGATLTAGVLAHPEARGLFHRAVVQSGNGLGAFSPEQAARVTRATAEALGAAPTAAGFAPLPDERFVEVLPHLAGLDLRTAGRLDPLVGLSPFSLVLERQPAEAVAAGDGADVPLLVGTNTEEGRLYLVPQGELEASTPEDLRATAARAHPDPDAALARVRARLPHAGPGELRASLLGEALFGTGSRRLAGAQAARGTAPVYTYEFSWRSPAVDGRLGAAHTVELPFVFDRLDLPPLRGPRGLLGDPAAPEPPAALTAEMHSAWVRFAHTGDPGWGAGGTRRFTGAP